MHTVSGGGLRVRRHACCSGYLDRRRSAGRGYSGGRACHGTLRPASGPIGPADETLRRAGCVCGRAGGCACSSGVGLGAGPGTGSSILGAGGASFFFAAEARVRRDIVAGLYCSARRDGGVRVLFACTAT